MFRFSQYMDSHGKPPRQGDVRRDGQGQIRDDAGQESERSSLRLGGTGSLVQEIRQVPAVGQNVGGRLFSDSMPLSRPAPPSGTIDAPAIADSAAIPPEPVSLLGDTSEGLYDQEPIGAYALAASMGIEIPTSRKQYLMTAKACLATVFSQLLGDARKRGMIWPMVLSIVADLEHVIAREANIVTVIDRERAKGEGIHWHSVYTAILAMELATYTKVKLEGTVHEIGAAALLHDIGLLRETTFINAISMTNENSFFHHSEKGADLALEAGAPEHVATMIRQHHEQIDGRGFPAGLRSGAILNASQVVGISDIFEHAIIDITNTSNAGNNAVPGLSQVFSTFRSSYQIQLMKDMMALIGYYPVGSLVELSNRSICEVISQNQNMPLRPIVKVIVDASGNHPEQSRIIDLHEIGVLSIVRAISSKGVAP